MTSVPKICPRCGADDEPAYYGPCKACSDELIAWALNQCETRVFIIQLTKFRWLA